MPPSTEDLDCSWLREAQEESDQSDVRRAEPSSILPSVAWVQPSEPPIAQSAPEASAAPESTRAMDFIDRLIWDAADAPELGVSPLAEAPAVTGWQAAERERPVTHSVPPPLQLAVSQPTVQTAAPESPALESDSPVNAAGTGPEESPVPTIPVLEKHGLDGSVLARRRTSPARLVAGLLLLASVGVWFALRPSGPRPVESTTSESESVPRAVPPELAKPVEEERPRVRREPAREASASAAPTPVPVTRSVAIHVRPPDAKVYRRGKRAGSSGMVVDLAPGERRAFEVGKRGYITRRVVVDGSKPEIRVVLQPTPNGRAP